MRETSLAAMANQDVPFEKLVEELAPARSLARHPLFQVMLSLENNAEAVLDLPGPQLPPAAARPAGPVETAAKFDLAFQISETAGTDGTPGELHGSMVAAADLFEQDSAGRIAERWTRVLAALVAEPATRLSAVDVLTEAERDLLLNDRNDTATTVAPATVPELFAAHAASTPDEVAVIAGGTQLTYGELDARANRLAHVLIQRGIGAESVVGLSFGRDEQMIVAVLAVWKAGAAYLPIDPEHPADRRAYLIADSGTTLVLTTEDALPGLPTDRAPVAVVDGPELRAALASAPDTAPETTYTDTGLAYVIYTSGSSGRPKGVGVGHGALANVVSVF
ncbi:AMP-binding protein, partial [Streptomyces sp. NPDC002530]